MPIALNSAIRRNTHNSERQACIAAQRHTNTLGTLCPTNTHIYICIMGQPLVSLVKKSTETPVVGVGFGSACRRTHSAEHRTNEYIYIVQFELHKCLV